MLFRELFLITTVVAAAGAVPVANPHGGYVTRRSAADPQIETASLAYALGGSTMPSSDVATDPVTTTTSTFGSQPIITDTYNITTPNVTSSAEVPSESNDEKDEKCDKCSSSPPAASEANNDKTCDEGRCMDLPLADPLSDKASGDDCGSTGPASADEASEPITPDERQTDNVKGCNKCKDADNQDTFEPADDIPYEEEPSNEPADDIPYEEEPSNEPADDIPYTEEPSNVALDDPASADEVTEPITPDAPDTNGAEDCDKTPTDAQAADPVDVTPFDESADPATYNELPTTDDQTTITEENNANDFAPVGGSTDIPQTESDEDCDRPATPADPAGDAPFTEVPGADPASNSPFTEVPGIDDTSDPAGDIPSTELPGTSETPLDKSADPALGSGFPYPDLPRTAADIPFADKPLSTDGPSEGPANFGPGSAFPNANIPFTPESEIIAEGCRDATSDVPASDPFSELPGSNQPVDGRCSAEFPCPSAGQCCSVHGYCGTTVEYCNADSITLPSFGVSNTTRVHGNPVVTNVCEPQPINTNDDCPCRGEPEPQGNDYGQFDPAIPTDGQFDPAIPTDGQFDPAIPTGGQFDPAIPTDGQFDPATPTDGQFDPATPTNDKFDPAIPTDDQFDPAIPTDDQFDPAIPTDDQFNPATPTDEFGEYPPEGFPEEGTVNDLPGSGPCPPQTEGAEDCGKCTEVDTQDTTGPAGEIPSSEVPSDVAVDDPAAEVPTDVAVGEPAYDGPQTEGGENCNDSGAEAADPVDSIPSPAVPDEYGVPSTNEELPAPFDEATPTGDCDQSDPAPAGENIEPGSGIPQTESEEGCDKCADSKGASEPAPAGENIEPGSGIPQTESEEGCDKCADSEGASDPSPAGENFEPGSGIPQTESEEGCDKCADPSTESTTNPAGDTPSADVPCDNDTDESVGTATDAPTTINEAATAEEECNKCADATSMHGAT